jgi:hypothetical protein
MAAIALPAWAATSPTQEEMAAAALQIDQQVAAFYRSKKLPVPEVADDATFLRRAFLVAIGRIPTSEEALQFLEIEDPAKRQELVSYLVSSAGYSSHMTNWAFDLLRFTDRIANTSATLSPYRQWIREAMAGNMPWDDFTMRLLASSGDGWDPETAGVGYYVRDRGMPLDNLSNTMQIFLGERMECAQCHDDPFGATERFDFYQLAAFTHGQHQIGRRAMNPIWNEQREEPREKGVSYDVARMLWDNVVGMSLGGGGEGRIALPQDYQYKDGEPGEMVSGKTPFGKTVRMSDKSPAKDGRKQFAEWVVNRTDGRFAEVIANRMWKRVMGRGLYEPVEEYQDAAKTHHPAMAALLSKLMQDFDYDLRSFQQTLMLTKTFQFATNPNPSAVEGGDDFHGRKISRLSAEQIWDSLITLAAGDPDKSLSLAFDDRIFIQGRPVLADSKTMRQLSREVLAIDSEKEMREYFVNLVGQIEAEGGGTDGQNRDMMMGAGARKRQGMIRASELPSPAPREHFLYLFGASDRQVVEAASREPNVGQVLSLMNGFVQQHLVNHDGAHVYRCLEDAGSDHEIVRRLYVSILNRPPGEDEMSWMLDELKESRDNGIRNIVSSLVMSSEFLFLQ